VIFVQRLIALMPLIAGRYLKQIYWQMQQGPHQADINQRS
jgi:hypothetical protein